MQSQDTPVIQQPTEISRSGEAEVHQFLTEFVEAICTGDLDRIMTFYSPDLVAFDMMPPLEFNGVEDYRNNWAIFTNYFKFPLEYGYEEQTATVSGDIAYVYSLAHMVGETLKGEPVENWLRSTIGLRKQDGKWLIVHEHTSVPIDSETGKGLMELKPKSLAH